MQRIAPVSIIALCIAACVLAGCATYDPPPAMVGTSSADQQLANDVTSRLSEDSVTGRYTYGVTTQNGVVTIQGAAPDETTRKRILGIVGGTPGVQGVVDRLYRM